MIDVIIIALATASIVKTFHAGNIFLPFRNWLIKTGINPNTWEIIKSLIRGIGCSYCFAHWVAIPVTLLLVPINWDTIVIYFAAVWLANHSMIIYEILSGMINNKHQ